MILDRKLRVIKMPIGRIFDAQTASALTTVEIVVCSLEGLRTGIGVKKESWEFLAERNYQKRRTC